MRTFLQRTAGATFFRGDNLTITVRKDYAEYIFKVGNGFYGVVNLLFPAEGEILLFAGWGNYFRRVTNHTDKNKLFHMLERPCPEVVKLFTRQSDYVVVSLSDNEMGISRRFPGDINRSLIEIMGEPAHVEEARNLASYSLKIFHEIYDHCPFPGWKQGLFDVF